MVSTQPTAPAFPMRRASGYPIDPPPEYGRLRAEQPVFRVTTTSGDQPWLVTRYEDVRTVLGSPRFSSNPEVAGYPQFYAPPTNLPPSNFIKVPPGNFAFMDPPEHTRYRATITREFTTKQVDALRRRIQKIVDNQIDDMLAGPRQVDLVKAFAAPVPSLVICELLGVPYEDHGLFEDRTSIMLRRGVPAAERQAANHDLLAYLDKLVADKERQPTDDLLGRLVVERLRQGELTHDELVGLAFLLLSGGHETTADTIGLGTLTLLQHPDQLAQLRANPGLVTGAVEELLRYTTVTHAGQRRVAIEDVEIGGQLIRTGEGVIALTLSANRDGSVFTEPDRFDIHRDARKHLTFSYGVHHCAGQVLARAELRIALATLACRIPTLRLAAAVDEIPFRHDMLVYGVHELPVTW